MRAVELWTRVLLLFLLATPAQAATIFFDMTLNGTTLTLTNTGDGSAFFPAVLRLMHDGRWEQASPPAGVVHPAELLPGASLEVDWPAPSPQQQAFPLEMFRPIMVRFFDESGTGFGQISFFTMPPGATTLVEAHYEDGLLHIEPPDEAGSAALRASWLLWPQEEGIATLPEALDFAHRQPPAQRIEWDGPKPLRLDLGAGLPAVMLLHETGSGLALQILQGGGVQGRQQRTAWLGAQDLFYRLAAGAAAAAVLLMLWLQVVAWRQRTTR